MSTIKRTLDRAYAIRIMSILSKEFAEWPAFKLGIIDITGNLIKRPKTPEEKAAYSRLDAVLRPVKVALNKFPGGVSALARAYLVKNFLYENFQENALIELHYVFESLCMSEGESEFNNIAPVLEALLGFNKEDPELVSIFEEMVAGDAGGDAETISKGENSGSVTFPGPSGKKKKKVDKKSVS